MRTKRIKLYPFNELSEESKRIALIQVAKICIFKTESYIIEFIEEQSYEFTEDGKLFS